MRKLILKTYRNSKNGQVTLVIPKIKFKKIFRIKEIPGQLTVIVEKTK